MIRRRRQTVPNPVPLDLTTGDVSWVSPFLGFLCGVGAGAWVSGLRTTAFVYGLICLAGLFVCILGLFGSHWRAGETLLVSSAGFLVAALVDVRSVRWLILGTLAILTVGFARSIPQYPKEFRSRRVATVVLIAALTILSLRLYGGFPTVVAAAAFWTLRTTWRLPAHQTFVYWCCIALWGVITMTVGA